jgi:hypothetical protein
MTEWRKIGGCDNYEVSNDGEIRNVLTGLILKPQHNKERNFYDIELSKNGSEKYLKLVDSSRLLSWAIAKGGMFSIGTETLRIIQ